MKYVQCYYIVFPLCQLQYSVVANVHTCSYNVRCRDDEFAVELYERSPSVESDFIEHICLYNVNSWYEVQPILKVIEI